jgi:hypothetical protein
VVFTVPETRDLAGWEVVKLRKQPRALAIQPLSERCDDRYMRPSGEP